MLLFDGDLGLSNIVVQLGLTQTAPFAAVLAGECAAHDAAIPVAGGAKRRGGFDVLAGPPGSGDLAGLDRIALTCTRTMASLRLAAGYDRVVLDLGAGVDETVLRFAAAADETIAVLTPDPSALTDAYALIKLLAKRCGRAARFVVNQANTPSEALLVTAETLINACRSFLTVVPRIWVTIRHDPKVADAIRRQTLLSTLHPRCAAAADISLLKNAREQSRTERPVRAAAMR